ncbi:hypothetical protein JHK84_053089 [Glycine max]|nr:hypothetical protein JHK84_053089 [Glycine max]
MVIQTSPIGVDGCRDKVVAMDFWFFLFVQVSVNFFSYMCLSWFRAIRFEEVTHLSSSNDVTLKLTSLTALL